MRTTKKHTTSGSTESDLSTTQIFDQLANDRRRFAVQYLSRTVGAVPVSELADQLALRDGDHTHDQYERICTSLVHIHLPKLAAAGVLDYDSERETVAPLESVDHLTPYLDLTSPGDGQ